MIQTDQDKFIHFEDSILAWEDKDTQLMWEVKSKEALNFMYAWDKRYVDSISEDLKYKFELDIQDCTSYVERMNNEKYAGFQNWRLPTIEELQSLINKEGEGRYIKNPLRYNTCPAYWSITPVMVVNAYKIPGVDWRDTAYIPVINILDFVKPETLSYSPEQSLWIRCVRSL